MSIRLGIGIDVFKSATGGGYDADALAFFARVIAAGGTLSGTEMTATNQLVLDMKSAGIWTSMKAVYPMVGASAAACAQNLISSSFTGTFYGGWTFASTGATSNGTNAYMSTSLIPDTQFATANDGNFGYYSRTDLVNAKPVMGANTINRWFIDFPFNANTFLPSINDGNIQPITTGYDKGFRQVSRNPTTLSQIQYRKNTTAYTFTQSSTNKPTNEVRLGMCEPTYYSSNEIAFAYVGNGQLTTTNQSDYYTAVQSFQTTLSRQV
jgi:hypothetical protein